MSADAQRHLQALIAAKWLCGATRLLVQTVTTTAQLVSHSRAQMESFPTIKPAVEIAFSKVHS
jgi:hypothetical protein